ncbi:NAD-dependent epimerase/dehydratase family protein [Pseudodonghicola flavimaris]|uniref:NAD(P)-dependent oxidoreductase n=1 Tax=Pseudodonghicola flavimaris TaxID=3050036 RepID=A0ABT7F1Q1_9RHOB|nr:NAD(P)-dependent oxidoreductase [Pseudodonghicola flavimaris]MDK3018535.1 NAD(P)-dependent oxidoreductase [Pseudodonghicola flavimaris]
MRVVVTGAAGLLGRHVAAACLTRGHEVFGLDTAPQPDGGWQQATADLSDLGTTVQFCQGADAILHCAAIPRPLGHAGAEVFRVNMATIYAATEAARLCRVGLFVYASSFSVLGYPFASPVPTPHYLPIDEDHPVAPQDIYGTSKWLGEELVAALVRQGALRAISLRMPWLQTPDSFARDIGPRRDTAAAAADLWAYLDARDAGTAFAQALDWQGSGHLRCYLSADDSYSDTPTRDLIAAAFGAAVPLRNPLPGHSAPIDCSLARRELGFLPRHGWRDYATEGDRR